MARIYHSSGLLSVFLIHQATPLRGHTLLKHINHIVQSLQDLCGEGEEEEEEEQEELGPLENLKKLNLSCWA